jgi:hypothetical protein
MNYTSPQKPALKNSAPLSKITVEEEINRTLSQIQILDKPELWDVQQVADWLNNAGFGAVASNFIGNIIEYINTYVLLIPS